MGTEVSSSSHCRNNNSQQPLRASHGPQQHLRKGHLPRNLNTAVHLRLPHDCIFQANNSSQYLMFWHRDLRHFSLRVVFDFYGARMCCSDFCFAVLKGKFSGNSGKSSQLDLQVSLTRHTKCRARHGMWPRPRTSFVQY